jgi:hypothetical protein
MTRLVIFGGKQALLTGALALAILAPLALPRGWDDFPISSYPMFSRNVGRIVTLGHALFVDESGERTPVPPAIVGTPEPMVAKNLVENAIARGQAAELCAQIASRANPPNAKGQRGVERVEIVTSTFDSRLYFQAARTPTNRTVHATCAAAEGAR